MYGNLTPEPKPCKVLYSFFSWDPSTWEKHNKRYWILGGWNLLIDRNPCLSLKATFQLEMRHLGPRINSNLIWSYSIFFKLKAEMEHQLQLD